MLSLDTDQSIWAGVGNCDKWKKVTKNVIAKQILDVTENHMLIEKIVIQVIHVGFIFSCQKITLEDLSDSKSVADEKSMKSAEHSVNSLATATHETSNVAVYEVWMHIEKELLLSVIKF